MLKLVALSVCLILGTGVALAGCNDTADTTTAPGDSASSKVDKTPVTLKVYPRVSLSEEEFQQYFVEPTKKKYPYITLELMQPSSLAKLVAGGETPDIIFGSQYYFNEFKNLDLLQDLNPYIKKYSVDLTSFNNEAMDVIKQAGKDGEIYAVPFSLNYGALFYNKDLFDKFGVDYPKDLMSWEELLPVIKKLTRFEDGTQFAGINVSSVGMLINAMGLAYLPADDKPDFTGEAFKKVFEFNKQLYDIPGELNSNNASYNRNDFIKNKNLAMFTDYTSGMAPVLEKAMVAGFTNWDVAAYPNFKDRLGYGRSVDFHLSVVTKSSKAKEQAFQVIMETASKDVQMLASSNGNISSLNDKEVQDIYASNLKSFKGKHIQNIFKTKMSVIPEESQYTVNERTPIINAMNDVALGKADINTALREAQEKAEKDIAKRKAGQ